MKNVMKKMGCLFLISALLVLSACSSGQEASKRSKDGKINVVTTIAQIGEPLSVIGGDRLNVKSLMGPSVDPHLYKATQSDMETLEEADIIFYNGLHLEANMVEIFEKISESKPVLAVGETIPEESLLKDEKGVVDPHIWFDLDLWQQALDAAVEQLKEFSPEDADYFEENKKKYFARLADLKKEAEKLADIPESQRVLVTAHDAFGYFGRMHGIKVVGLQGLSTDSEIGITDIQDTIDIIKKYKVPAVFIESSINEKSIKAVIEGAKSEGINVTLGGELYSDAMGEEGTEEGTYIGMYRHNINTIYEALSEGGK
ncbi:MULTISPECIES: metal ABC transporter solute-binding protein, Zn/Mn family [Aeribacillus]|jgi:manganese/zinc/iron transport system substrate-binding protein|uniref:Manganese transporter n=1 Tax=Aeribacillus pallidus TaxID=33936 RepID=A0A164BQB5_9BACI|nr:MULTISPECIES: zinc ABC transporter substrate-binding protein [Aeribacillus]ASS90073.1 manganese transporter [Aeribacillus pallidus]KZM57653.1 manganese transporter [Aeribacillus pallidus]MED0651785.1 zinc ABC transporter substrate-binding protein [Aeribacillus composti]MED1443333.1 zinc ABC transporter substrate-binding protein [Aeribacillus composti]MED4486319.1 zinc ABC transporter substrate-binding protein [Aeribacillus pallidus]